MICNGTLLKKTCGRAAFPRRISARRCWRRRWDRRRRRWGRWGRRGVRCWRRGKAWGWWRRWRRYWAVLSDRIRRRGRRSLRRRRWLLRGGWRVAIDGRRGARARARALSQEIGERRQREMGRVIVVGLDRAKVSTISFRESPRAIQADIVIIMSPHFNHHPRAVPAQRIIAMLTHLHRDPRSCVAVGGDGDRRASVLSARARVEAKGRAWRLTRHLGVPILLLPFYHGDLSGHQLDGGNACW